jgi:hypothetical protein
MPNEDEVVDGRKSVMRGFAEDAWAEGNSFFYIRIPEPLLPLERGSRYEEPLAQALEATGLGEVTGGGSQMGEGDTVEFCGVDVVVCDREKGLNLVCSVMRQLGAPGSTVIEEYIPEHREHLLASFTHF